MWAQLSSWNFVVIGILSVLCAILLYYLQRIQHDLKIRKIPGIKAPSLATNPFSAVILIFKTRKAQKGKYFLEHFNSFFDTRGTPESPHCVELHMRPRSRAIITRDPEHVKAILAGNFRDFGKGQRFHRLWRPFLGDSIFTTDGHLWHDSRALIRPMFIKERVSDLATFGKGAETLMAKLPPSGETVDIMDLLYRMTLDITTEFLLGASVDSLNNPQSEFSNAFNEVQQFQMLLTIVGPFEVLIPRWRYNQNIKALDRFVMPYIEQALALPQEELEKISNSDKNFTFLHSIARYTRDPRVLRDQLVAVLIAGRDTTAATLSWAFYELSRYPDKVERLRKEVISVVGRTGSPTYDDLKRMPYLRHTVNETLRLYPAVPYNVRAALADSTLPGAPGQPPIAVAAGDIVIYSLLSMQRRKDLYPPVSEKFADPALFSPERWEVWTPKPWQYVPFNGGPRICVGQNFALTEMACCLTKILQKYDRLEYRGDWYAQRHEPEIVGKPSHGVPVALYKESFDLGENV
ncbi:cytochrome P450 [Biscogniauxia mediterranea]|nr:cytochrome P450 [Biscogniauxia mediterranea]